MGEISDQMIDGDLCQGCGIYIGDTIGQFCDSCIPEDFGEEQSNCLAKDGAPLYRPNKVNCPYCGKLVKKLGLRQHIKRTKCRPR